MRVQYVYQDKFFDDIRDIVNNNKLSINYAYLFEEYLPFQVFCSGETAFKGVYIKPTSTFEPGQMGRAFSPELFEEGVREYLLHRHYHSCKRPVAAVSGGIDSSVVALHCQPDWIYSGYYPVDGYSELEYSKLVAETLDVEHLQIQLNEEDFIEGMIDYMDVICTPVAGFGGVMEYITLQRALHHDNTVDGVLFGNGGDEVFMGYFFNHFVIEFFQNGHKPPPYMPNFLPSKARVTESMLDTMIVSSINRMGDRELRGKTGSDLVKRLSGIKNVFDKLLYINLNITLPSLLHVNQQMCLHLGVNSFNPLSNDTFVKYASRINMPSSVVPKHKLRDVQGNLPQKIKDRRDKSGFPMPLSRWKDADAFFKELWEAFKHRDWYIGLPDEYPGLGRVSWAVSNIELFLQRYS